MNRIKECRLQRGMSQKYVAVSIGVAAPSVWGWENGKNSPTPANLAALADLFGVSVDYLIGRDETETEQPAATIPPVGDIDDALAEVAAKLTPEEVTQVLAFIAGMRAARKG